MCTRRGGVVALSTGGNPSVVASTPSAAAAASTPSTAAANNQFLRDGAFPQWPAVAAALDEIKASDFTQSQLGGQEIQVLRYLQSKGVNTRGLPDMTISAYTDMAGDLILEVPYDTPRSSGYINMSIVRNRGQFNQKARAIARKTLEQLIVEADPGLAKIGAKLHTGGYTFVKRSDGDWDRYRWGDLVGRSNDAMVARAARR